MKVIISRGKYKDTVVEVSQWCNDWFTLNSDNAEIARKPYSPSSLLFPLSGIKEIEEHNNNGMLFNWYEVKPARAWRAINGVLYAYTFVKRKI